MCADDHRVSSFPVRCASRMSTRMLRDSTNRPGASRHSALERRGISKSCFLPSRSITLHSAVEHSGGLESEDRPVPTGSETTAGSQTDHGPWTMVRSKTKLLLRRSLTIPGRADKQFFAVEECDDAAVGFVGAV